jgi:uncharacterized protein YdhG (YjbR/CyaY superfamily)
MANDPRAQVRAYLAAQPPRARAALRAIRKAIGDVIPKGEDGFSYRIPAVTLEGKTVVWYAGFASHVSLFPMGETIRRAFAKEIAGLGTSTGTIRFPLAKRLPVGLVKRLVRARLAEFRVKGR